MSVVSVVCCQIEAVVPKQKKNPVIYYPPPMVRYCAAVITSIIVGFRVTLSGFSKNTTRGVTVSSRNRVVGFWLLLRSHDADVQHK